MTIHVWKHWFWITLSCYSFVLLLFDKACVEAGLLVGVPSNVSSSTRYDVVATTSGIMSDDSGPYASDMDDTYNGDNEDIVFPIPLPPISKKYPSKYPLGKKYKPKSKSDDGINEKPINYMEEKYDVSIKRVVQSEGNTTVSKRVMETLRNTTDESNGKLEGPKTDTGYIPESTSKQTIELETNSTEDAVNGTEAALGDAPVDVTGDQTQLTLVQNYTDDDGLLPTSLEPFGLEGKMAVAAATIIDNGDRGSSALDAGSITGITLAIVVIASLSGAVSFVLYRRRYLNKPQVLNDKSSTLDSSGYIDDASLRENSEEMYSLDNDSFLNSLEAMTIQNYWTESVKHTKL